MSEKLKKEFTFNLDTPLTYADGTGAEQEANTLTIKAPTMRLAKPLSVLNSAFAKGQLEAASKITNREDKQNNTGGAVDGPGYYLMLSCSGELEKCTQALEQILEATALLDGKKEFKNGHFSEMSATDAQRLLGEYFVNFLTPSH